MGEIKKYISSKVFFSLAEFKKFVKNSDSEFSVSYVGLRTRYWHDKDVMEMVEEMRFFKATVDEALTFYDNVVKRHGQKLCVVFEVEYLTD